jgi:hypothetical protein
VKSEIDESESIAKEVLTIFEKRTQNEELTGLMENRITRKMSSALELIAEIYELKKEYY